MHRGCIAILALAATLGAALPSFAQTPRKDFIWARSTAGAPITMDGKLNEPAWAQAESVVIVMAQDTGIPGSGWFYEAGIAPIDPTHATLRFLTVDDTLYMGAYVRDHSVGGNKTFNRFDGLLMSLKDHSTGTRPAPPAEYFYSWWYPEDSIAAVAPGAPIRFRGRWTGCNDNPSDCPRPRTAEEKLAWDAVTTVGGIVNDDNNVDADPNDNNDWGYVVEMKFNLAVMGYDITRPGGDVAEWNVSIYDCDWQWPFQGLFSANRVWWQNPWGNDFWFHNVRVIADPAVTVASGPTPPFGPDVYIPAGDHYAAPVMDGSLSELVWQNAPHFDIRYDDTALRASYPGEGPWRSGQYQIYVNGYDGHDLQHPIPQILDPADCTVKWFHKGNRLYLGFDARDQIVQYYGPDNNRYDGFIVTLNDYAARSTTNNQLKAYRYTFRIGAAGQALAEDELPALISQSGAQVVTHLKNPSTNPADTTDRLTSDLGYTAEMWIDLTKVGYPSGLGDRRIFLGIDHLDGDTFTNAGDSYSARVWWQREHAGGSGSDGGSRDGPAWGYLDPLRQVVAVQPPEPGPAIGVSLLGNRPNPFRDVTSVAFTLARPGEVRLEVFDLLGRHVASRACGRQPAGTSHVIFKADGLRSGLYDYRLIVAEDGAGPAATATGRMLVRR
jgi:hypothetical protein